MDTMWNEIQPGLWLGGTPDDEWLGQFGHDDRKTGMVEAIGHTGRQVTAAAEEDRLIEEKHWLFIRPQPLHYLPR